MAATLTVTEATADSSTAANGSIICRYTLAWTSHTDGTVALPTPTINGTILRVTFNPGATAPTDNYDVTLTDEDGIDVLGGQGANRDTANSESVCPGLAFTDGTTTSVVPIAVAGTLTLNVSNAGDSKQGTVVLYVR
jgi:hypothetical protein